MSWLLKTVTQRGGKLGELQRSNEVVESRHGVFRVAVLTVSLCPGRDNKFSSVCALYAKNSRGGSFETVDLDCK